MNIARTCRICGGKLRRLTDDICPICDRNERLERLQRAIRSGIRTMTYAEEEVICPWCGEVNEFEESCKEQYVEGVYEMTCCECGKKFELTTNVSISYDTKRLREE